MDLVFAPDRTPAADPAATRSAVGVPYCWQEPAITEKAAWDAIAKAETALPFVYVGVPWATIIDGVRNDTPAAWDLLRRLEEVKAELDRMPPRRRVTVVQHIHALEYRSLFEMLGITDVFWSHARHDTPAEPGLTLHPFPLYPAQTGSQVEHEAPHRPRRWLANFIGAYDPNIYLSDVRARIFADEGAEDILILKRESWHFHRAVYAEQIRGIPADTARLALERQQKEEYLAALRDSIFTLCPTGSGPNSIRIYEALALGSIPVILTHDLALPGDPALWEACCLLEEDSAEGYIRARAAMRAMSEVDIRARQAAITGLFAAVGPEAYCLRLTDRVAHDF